MRFVKEHLIGIVLGIVAYELYYRQQRSQGGGGG
jgi:hypothetical protein